MKAPYNVREPLTLGVCIDAAMIGGFDHNDLFIRQEEALESAIYSKRNLHDLCRLLLDDYGTLRETLRRWRVGGKRYYKGVYLALLKSMDLELYDAANLVNWEKIKYVDVEGDAPDNLRLFRALSNFDPSDHEKVVRKWTLGQAISYLQARGMESHLRDQQAETERMKEGLRG